MLADHQGRISRWTLALLSILSMKGPDGVLARSRQGAKAGPSPFLAERNRPHFHLRLQKKICMRRSCDVQKVQAHSSRSWGGTCLN